MKPVKQDAKKLDLQQKTVSVLSDNQLNAVNGGKNEESGPAGYLFQVAENSWAPAAGLCLSCGTRSLGRMPVPLVIVQPPSISR